MAIYGLTPQGFIVKPLTVIKAELEDKFKAAYGASIGSEPDGSIPPETVIGQLIGIMAEREALLWEQDQAIHAAGDPDRASGTSLDAIAAITGTVRNPQRFSQAILTATGDPGTVLTIGRVVSVQGANTRFDTQAMVTLLAHPTWLTATMYALGDRVVSDTPERVYLCVIAGTSGATAPVGTGSAISDGGATWRYLGDGSASADVLAIAEVAGPFAAVSGTLTEIETPVSGWKSAINILDAVVGDYAEGDPEFRIRRENELEASANATINAIRANILQVGRNTANPVTACTVFQNTTLITNVDGVPGKAVEVLVRGGDDTAIRQAVFDTVAGGIQAYGNNSGTVIDSAGNPHTVAFSRATSKNIYIEIDLQKIDGQYPINGDDAVKLAIVNALKFPNHSFGTDVTGFQISAPLDGVPGVFDVTAVRLGLAPLPVGTARIPIGPREIAEFDTSRIVVSSSSTTP